MSDNILDGKSPFFLRDYARKYHPVICGDIKFGACFGDEETKFAQPTMKPLIIVHFPQGVDKDTVDRYRNDAIASHPDYEFLFVSEGLGLSIAHEGNITVAEVIKMKD